MRSLNHDNASNPNYRRLMASLLKRFWCDKMTFDCKSHCQRCIVCNRAKPDRRGGAALQPLGIPEYMGNSSYRLRNGSS